MSFPTRQSVAVTTDSGGAATVYSTTINGKLIAIHYVKTDFANGVDFTITAEATGETLWSGTDVNAATSVYPRVGSTSTAGAALLYAAGGTAVADYIRLANDRVKIVIAQGGSVKSGTFIIVTE